MNFKEKYKLTKEEIERKSNKKVYIVLGTNDLDNWYTRDLSKKTRTKKELK